jgi:hypothetical protein
VEQGGCGKKHNKFTKIEAIEEAPEELGERLSTIEPEETETPEQLGKRASTIEPETKEVKKPKKEKKTAGQIKLEKIKIAREKEEETDRQLKEAQIENLESSCYTEMDNYVGMVRTGAAYGCILEGRGGTGKTWRVINLLKDVEFAYTDSFTTPQALYCWLYANRNKEVLVIDDVSGFLTDNKVLAFLKGGLWHVGENKNRIIHYMTTKPMQDNDGNYVPNAFILNARMIIITNKLNRKNPHLNAILTRVNYCRVEIDYDELMNILEQVTQKDYPGLTKEERMDVFNFIKDKTSEANDDLNIRSLIKCFQQRVYSKQIHKPELWKQLAMMSILQKNPALVILESLLKDPKFATEKERVEEFRRLTGRGRASYFRYKQQLAEVGDNLTEPKEGG